MPLRKKFQKKNTKLNFRAIFITEILMVEIFLFTNYKQSYMYPGKL